MGVSVSSVRLDHLGLHATLAEEIGFVDELDALVQRDPRQTLSFGQTVLAMVFNAVGFTSRPLYMSPDFFKRRELKFLLGGSRTQPNLVLQPEHLNEHKLGRALDAIAELGPDRVFLRVATRAFKALKVKVQQLHLDTTTHSFHGVYKDEEGNPLGADFKALDPHAEDGIVEVLMAEGFSKDYRLHCKQVVQELLVSGDGDVPLLFRAHSGNASDVVIMRERMENLKRCLAEAGAEDLMPRILVGDCKLYSEESVRMGARDGTTWVTRVPDSIKETSECIERALRGRGHWKSSEHDKRVSFQEFTVSKWDVVQTYVVVRTESSKARMAKAMPKRLKKDVEALEKRLTALRKTEFACLPDLETALSAAFKPCRYLILKSFEHEVESVRRSRGRPRKDEFVSPTIETYYLGAVDYSEDKEALRQDELASSCFVLATNATENALSTEEVLQSYLKDQQGVERSFRFLKDPQYFCDAFFLKNPSRVVALLCVMTLALLVHALLQRMLRLKLADQKTTIEDQKGKPTALPTLRWVNQKFEGIDVIKVREPHRTWFKFEAIDKFVQSVLRILGPPYETRYSPASLSI
jgi:transposase